MNASAPGMRSQSIADATLRFLLTTSITAIAIDEFNVSLGFFSLKASIAFFGASLLPFLFTRTDLDRRALLILVVLVCILLSGISRYLGFGDFANNGDIDFTIASRTIGLIILLIWTLLLVSSLSSLDLQRAYIWTFSLLLLKGIYILWLFLHGSPDAIFWLPTGEPRFALNRGGMTPNQAGAIWLTIFLFFQYQSNTHPRYSQWKAYPILAIALLLGTMSGSRSFVIGVFLSSFFWLTVRYRLAGFFGGLSVSAIGTATYLAVFPDRGADESALGRFEKWALSLENIGNNPVLGSGVGSDSSPHNTLLQVLSESGFLGLTAFLIMILAFLVWRGRFLTTSFFAFVLPYLFFLMVDIGLMQWQTWLLLATAVIIGRERIEAFRSHSRTGSSGRVSEVRL